MRQRTVRDFIEVRRNQGLRQIRLGNLRGLRKGKACRQDSGRCHQERKAQKRPDSLRGDIWELWARPRIAEESWTRRRRPGITEASGRGRGQAEIRWDKDGKSRR